MLMDSVAQVLRGWPYDGARDSNEQIQQGAVLKNGDVVTAQLDGTVNKVGATSVGMAGLVVRGNGDASSNAGSIARFMTPQPAYATTAIAWASGYVTVTTGSAHGYAVGNVVTVAGATPAGYNGTFTVVSVPSTTTFTYALAANPGAATVQGTVTLVSPAYSAGVATVLWGNYLVRTQNYAAGAWVPGAAVTAKNGTYTLAVVGTDPVIGYVRRVQAASATQTAAVDIEVL